MANPVQLDPKDRYVYLGSLNLKRENCRQETQAAMASLDSAERSVLIDPLRGDREN